MIKSRGIVLGGQPVHELGITDQLLSLTLKHAEQAGASRVARLNLVIGEFSSVVDESIQFYWDMMTENTLAEGAELVFTRVPGELECEVCGEIVSFSAYEGQCPACGGAQMHIHNGSQFQLESIEVEGVNVHEPSA
jgi:hydrogenase nickel incorporation protein HypA/HybF